RQTKTQDTQEERSSRIWAWLRSCSGRVKLASLCEITRTQEVGQARLMRVECLPRSVIFEPGERSGGIFLTQVMERLGVGIVAAETQCELVHRRVMTNDNKRPNAVRGFAQQFQNRTGRCIVKPFLDVRRGSKIADGGCDEFPRLAGAAGRRDERAMGIPAAFGHGAADLNRRLLASRGQWPPKVVAGWAF